MTIRQITENCLRNWLNELIDNDDSYIIAPKGTVQGGATVYNAFLTHRHLGFEWGVGLTDEDAIIDYKTKLKQFLFDVIIEKLIIE